MGFWGDFGEALLPTQQSGESRATYRWRQLVAVSIFVEAIAIVLTNVLLWGFAQPLYPGVAGKDMVGSVQTQVNDIRLDQITRNLRDARTAECVAQQQSNAVALQFAQAEVMRAYQAYYGVTKATPRIPDCQELVLATPQAPRN